VGTEITVTATLNLGKLKPGDVSVEAYYGPLDQKRKITEVHSVVLEHKENSSGTRHVFEGKMPCQRSGLHGYTVRVLPSNEDLVQPYELGLILWQ